MKNSMPSSRISPIYQFNLSRLSIFAVLLFINRNICLSFTPLSRYNVNIAITSAHQVSGISRSGLYLFNWGKKPDSKSTASSAPTVTTAGKKVDDAKLQEMKKGLEKIQKTQNRDYEAEAKARQPKPVEIKDKQTQSFNFNKQNEFPNLYKGWIKKDGDQIAKQMIASTKSALSKGEKLIEVLFDPVPNLDEVAFGTEWNQKLRKEVIENLKVPDAVARRGGPSTLEWANLYWANRLAAGIISGKQRIVAVSISGEGLKGQYLPTFTSGLSLVSLSEAKSPAFEAQSKGDKSLSALIVISPCSDTHCKDAKMLSEKLQVPVILLNSPYSFRYDVGCGPPFNLAYVMKRIPKGWIYRQYPKEFEAIVEGPNYEIFRVKTFKDQPKLTEISSVSMQASEAKYGATGNDRIFQNRL